MLFLARDRYTNQCTLGHWRCRDTVDEMSWLDGKHDDEVVIRVSLYAPCICLRVYNSLCLSGLKSSALQHSHLSHPHSPPFRLFTLLLYPPWLCNPLSLPPLPNMSSLITSATLPTSLSPPRRVLASASSWLVPRSSSLRVCATVSALAALSRLASTSYTRGMSSSNCIG